MCEGMVGKVVGGASHVELLGGNKVKYVAPRVELVQVADSTLTSHMSACTQKLQAEASTYFYYPC